MRTTSFDTSVGPSATNIITRLSNYITSQSFEKMFAPFGVIEQARLVVDPRTKKPKGFGFVRFQSETEAQKALKALNGRIVDGRLIFVEVAETTKHGDE
ncbi:Organelle RRM domain-containing protein 6, chloroplastic [Linum perenne]